MKPNKKDIQPEEVINSLQEYLFKYGEQNTACLLMYEAMCCIKAMVAAGKPTEPANEPVNAPTDDEIMLMAACRLRLHFDEGPMLLGFARELLAKHGQAAQRQNEPQNIHKIIHAHTCTHKWGVEFSTHNHEPARTVCVKCGYKPDTHALNTAFEPVSVPTKTAGAMPSGMSYTVEPHGNGYAIYQGRDNMHHGANLASLSECTKEFARKIETALNAANEPVKCDGNHGGPRCSDPECWNDSPAIDYKAMYEQMCERCGALDKAMADERNAAFDEALKALEPLYARAMAGKLQGDDLEPHDEMYNVGQLGQAHGISQAQIAIMELKSNQGKA